MSRYSSYAIKGQRVGGQLHESVVEEPREPAPRQVASYHCDRDCLHSPFTVPLAAEVAPPAALDCRCGGTGRLGGAPEDAEVNLPGYGQQAGGTAKGSKAKEGMDPIGQFWKRRSRAEAEENLAERMAWVRENGVAR